MKEFFVFSLLIIGISCNSPLKKDEKKVRFSQITVEMYIIRKPTSDKSFFQFNAEFIGTI